MAFTPTTLSLAEIDCFHTDGFVIVRGAFSPSDARAMQDAWWAELAQVHGIARENRETWRSILGDLKQAKTSALQHAIATPRVKGVIDDLLGEGAWAPPREWGRVLTTFPEPGPWDVPTGLWHWDSPVDWHLKTLNALFVVSLIGAVAPRAGGTLVLSGSPRLLARHEATEGPMMRKGEYAARRESFYRSHPWLMALTGNAPSPADRIAAFMQEGAEIDGVRARVVELTGEPGDMVFCHPTIAHCVAPNRGVEPRFMRIKQQLMTRRGQALLKG